MAQQELLFWQDLSSSKLRSCWTKVTIALNVGLHPLKISDGFDIAVDIATKKL